MSHYIERYCPEHGYYEADDGGDQECDQCRAQGKLQYQIADKRIADLERENAALRLFGNNDCTAQADEFLAALKGEGK